MVHNESFQECVQMKGSNRMEVSLTGHPAAGCAVLMLRTLQKR